MLNEFIIKSSLRELESLGYNEVECSRLFDEDNKTEGCVFKFKDDDRYFYSLCFYDPEYTFSFESFVLQPIKCIISDYSSVANIYAFEKFIKHQCFNKAYFEYNRVISFYSSRVRDLIEDLANKYSSTSEFMSDLDKIDLRGIIYYEEDSYER